MQIELSDIPSGDANFDGGFAGVYKRFEQGKTLAVKVLRKRSNPNLQKMARVSELSAHLHPFYALALTITL